jgi:hypothetical protein
MVRLSSGTSTHNQKDEYAAPPDTLRLRNVSGFELGLSLMLVFNGERPRY